MSDTTTLNEVSTKRGHTDKIGGAAWHPAATIGMGSDGLNFATGGGEGNVNLWSLDGYVRVQPGQMQSLKRS